MRTIAWHAAAAPHNSMRHAPSQAEQQWARTQHLGMPNDQNEEICGSP